MSARSQLVLEAIYAKTNVAAVVGLGKLSAIYDSAAKNAAEPFCYGIIQRQAPEPVDYAFGPTVVLQADLWLLKVVNETSATSKSPPKLAEELLANWITTLGNTLTISGGSVVWCEVFADMPPFQEKLGDRWIFHRGALVRIVSNNG